ncbi:MAG: DNA/RNA nuclease SfsA [Pseudomonadota bacterium]
MTAFGPLREARLERRYKRFLADVSLSDGSSMTVHCPNTGAMTGCAPAGARVWLSHSDSPKRKYAYTWELVETVQGMACIHSALANRVVREAFEAGRIPGFEGYCDIRAEVKYGQNSRADLYLAGAAGEVYVEVKCVTLCRSDGLGAFPDAVSERGRKHLAELAAVVGPRCRAIMFYCAFHEGICRVCAAGDIDPRYREALLEAEQAGVEVLAWGSEVTTAGVTLARPLPFSVDAEE